MSIEVIKLNYENHIISSINEFRNSPISLLCSPSVSLNMASIVPISVAVVLYPQNDFFNR